MSLPQTVLAVALSAAFLSGCQALGGGGGVMAETDVGPPPSLRDALPNRPVRSSGTDASDAALAATPTRPLALPKTVRGEGRTAEAETRRIDREELESRSDGRGRGGGGVGPSLTPGGVGLGGSF